MSYGNFSYDDIFDSEDIFENDNNDNSTESNDAENDDNKEYDDDIFGTVLDGPLYSIFPYGLSPDDIFSDEDSDIRTNMTNRNSMTDINNNEKTGKDSHEEETNVKERVKSVNDVRKITII